MPLKWKESRKAIYFARTWFGGHWLDWYATTSLHQAEKDLRFLRGRDDHVKSEIVKIRTAEIRTIVKPTEPTRRRKRK